MLQLTTVSLLWAGLVAQAAPETAAPPAAQLVREVRTLFGSRAEVQIFTADPKAARAAITEVFAELARLEALFSASASGSDVSRINLAAGLEPVKVAPETVQIVNRGLEISRLANGAFALSWMALHGLWDLSPTVAVRTLPGPERIAERLALVDDRQVQLEPQAGTVRLGAPGMAISVDGLAQGYAAHRGLALLEQKGFTDALVFVGGDVAARGKRGERSWLVGIQDPRATGFFAVLPLEDRAVATTGDYEHFVEIEGKRYHHVLDPRSGLPAALCRSATVVAADAATADALATAVFVLGPEKGLELIDTIATAGAVIVNADNQVSISRSLKELVRLVRPPTQ